MHLMLVPRPVLAELELRLGAPTRGLRVVEVPVDLDPLDLVRSGAAAFGFAAFFASPEGREIGAIGAARRFTASGPQRLVEVDRSIAEFDPSVPILVGFAFSDDDPPARGWAGFPAAAAIVPVPSPAAVAATIPAAVLLTKSLRENLRLPFLSSFTGPPLCGEPCELGRDYTPSVLVRNGAQNESAGATMCVAQAPGDTASVVFFTA